MNTNGLPPKPEGYTTPETQAPAPELSIVPVGDVTVVPVATPGVMRLGYIGCVLAGAVAPASTILAAFVAGYATMLLTSLQGIRVAAVSTLLGVLACVVSGFFLGAELIPSAVLLLLVASAMGVGLGSGKLTSSGACLLCALATLVLLGGDWLIAALGGQDLNELVLSALKTSFTELTSSGMVTSETSLDMLLTVMGYVWPSGYTLQALICIIVAALGTRLARSGYAAFAPRTLTFTVFDPPLWVAGVLLVSIVGLTVAQFVPAHDAVLTLSINLALAVRFAFGISGIAVAAWFMRRRGAGIAVTLVVAGVLVFLDLQIFVMAIVGLVDFWANFRHLKRGDKRAPKTV